MRGSQADDTAAEVVRLALVMTVSDEMREQFTRHDEENSGSTHAL